MQFYTKGEDGNFSEATADQINGEFKARFERFKQTETPKIRTELEGTVREELTPTLTEEITKKVESEYKIKLDAAQNDVESLNTQLRRKTIAAEYGFKAELEDFLGNGTEEEMKAKADILKSNSQAGATPPQKKTTDEQPKIGIVSKVA